MEKSPANYSMTSGMPGGEPRAANYRGTSDQEHRVVAPGRGSRREGIVDREIAVSRQRDGINDSRAMD